jgi:hypothetical protein
MTIMITMEVNIRYNVKITDDTNENKIVDSSNYIYPIHKNYGLGFFIL